MKYLRLQKILEGVTDNMLFGSRTMTFNGGERHIKLHDISCIPDDVTIESNGNVMDILLATDALRRVGVKHINLLMPYVPYARQDRVMIPGEPLSAKVFANVINSAMFDKVYTLDNHSPVITALLDNVQEIDQTRIYENVFLKADSPILICPDSGATKRTYAVAKYFGGLDVVECSKRRNVTTGDILETEVHAENMEGRDCYIIDDICDGGRTFVEIAKVLKTRNCGKIILYVSHGIFSNGFVPFVGLIDEIYTTIVFDAINIPIETVTIISLREEDLI